MKVLHVIPSLNKEDGGPSKAVIDMCKYQNKKGITSEIATTYKKKKRKLSNIKLYSFKGYLDYKYSLGLKRWLNKNIVNYDVIHIHSIFSYPAFITSKISKKKNKPYIIRTIGQLYPWCLSQNKLKKKIYIKLIEKKTLESASFVHFTTKHEKENIELNIRNNSYILPLGVKIPEKIDKEGFNKLFPEIKNKKNILFLSRIHPKKGLDILVPALKHILKKQKNLFFVIAGNDKNRYAKKIKKKIKALGLEEKIKFTGFISGKRKNALFQHSSFFILSSYTENFGIAVIEALASGIPVCISDNVGIHDKIKEYNVGEVFKLKKEDINKSINKILNNREKYLENCEKIVKKEYSWEKTTEKQINIYKECLKERQIKK